MNLETIALGTSGRQTTRLGFGCSSIMGALGRRDSLAMLEAAWDAGIRHFDVAPMYGYGEAEACVGEFLSRHKGHATVTTKFGIPASPGGTAARLARSVLRPVVHRFPGLKGMRKAPVAAPLTSVPDAEKAEPEKSANPIFNVEEARKSLHDSLAALKAERVDVWLLHDVTPPDLRDEGLLRFLEDSVKSGTVGTFGVGTDRRQIDPLLEKYPAYCQVLQYEWSVFNPVPAQTKAFRIHHRSLTNNFRSLHADLLANSERSARWSQATGADLADAEVLAKLLFKAALLLNPESVILFSSKSPGHIHTNVAVAADESLSAAALELYRIVQSELVGAGPVEKA